MKNNIDSFFEKYLVSLNESSALTQEQKDAILKKVLVKTKEEDCSSISKLRTLVIEYPWRFAVGASALQAVILTPIFGSNYTNLIFQFIGR